MFVSLGYEVEENTLQSNIEQARAYIMEKVLTPALESTSVSKKAKDTIRNSIRWLEHFHRVGDLIEYMNRFRGESQSVVFKSLKEAQLLTFEDIRGEFQNKFSYWASDSTRLEDFVIGKEYSSFDLAIFAKHYDTRSGGILPIGPSTQPVAVFIKVTLHGGKYPNEWISDGQVLKYYLKSRKGVFNEVFFENASIIQHPDVPVYAFVRATTEGLFNLVGTFRNKEVHTEADGSKWFELRKVTSHSIITEEQLDSDLNAKLAQSSQLDKKQRQARLQSASKKPLEVVVISRGFIRNADVITEVLFRAAGNCEGCGGEAPFVRNSDGSPYLEVHHKIRLADGGEDTVENALALCPNCHRREHYGPTRWRA
jgi:5-methylcytosine-specific restriction protein A